MGGKRAAAVLAFTAAWGLACSAQFSTEVQCDDFITQAEVEQVLGGAAPAFDRYRSGSQCSHVYGDTNRPTLRVNMQTSGIKMPPEQLQDLRVDATHGPPTSIPDVGVHALRFDPPQADLPTVWLVERRIDVVVIETYDRRLVPLVTSRLADL